jgi:hypothetical protein
MGTFIANRMIKMERLDDTSYELYSFENNAVY